MNKVVLTCISALVGFLCRIVTLVYRYEQQNERVCLNINLFFIVIIIIIYLSWSWAKLLTRSFLTYPEVSSKVYHDPFCLFGSSVSLPWVIYFEAFYLHVVIIIFVIMKSMMR